MSEFLPLRLFRRINRNGAYWRYVCGVELSFCSGLKVFNKFNP